MRPKPERLDDEDPIKAKPIKVYPFNIDELLEENTRCHGAAVGRLGCLHDYPFWMFPFLCLD